MGGRRTNNGGSGEESVKTKEVIRGEGKVVEVEVVVVSRDERKSDEERWETWRCVGGDS